MEETTKKPAWKTLGFWATVALTNVGLLLASGLVMSDSVAKAIGWVTATLTALGYKALSDRKPSA